MLLLQADPAAGGMWRDEDVAIALQLLRHGSHVRLLGIGHELHCYPSHVPRVLDAITPFLETVRGAIPDLRREPNG